ncbi:MAG: hypothetical protein V4574_03110 [Pseudomonadota bacterium]
MTEIFLKRGIERRPLALGRLLGEGAAGKVYAIEGMPGSAAKLYHGEAECRRHEAKIEAMIASPPDLPPAMHNGVRHPQIAWPEAKLYDRGGRFIGFLMPEIDFRRSTSLVNLLQKSSRRIEKLSDYYGYRVLVARNLASVFAELHRAGHHMIDMKPANLRFYPSVSWMAVVDTDGFSITGKNGRIAADVLSDEYIAPESWKREPRELGEAQDLFALAVIIFQLLNNGLHPFAGAAGGSAQATDLQARILEGLYPYAMRPRAGLAPSAASVHRMFRRGTRVLFDSAFQPRARRPRAEEWRDHLDLLMGQLTKCAAKPDEHVHFGAGCGFCGHEARVAAAKAKPAVKALPPIARTRRHPVPVGRIQRGVAMAATVRQPMPRMPQLRSVKHRPRRRIGGWGGMVVALALVATAFATQDAWRPLLPGVEGSARAADIAETALPDVPEAPDAKIAAFAEPRDYLILPAGGALSVPLRRGPGDDFAVIERLSMHDAVVGRGTSPGANGVQWVSVMRASDGVTGFVQQGALLRRAQPGVMDGLPQPRVDDAELAAGKQLLDARYRQLLANAQGYDRAYLSDGQKLWEAQRLRCDDDSDPAHCRKTLDARRRGDLEGWREAELMSRAKPRLTAASLEPLR